MERRDPNLAVAITLFALFVGMVAAASTYPTQARLVPLVFGIPAALLALWQLRAEVSSFTRVRGRADSVPATLWLAGFAGMVLAGGFVAGGTLAVMACQRFWLKESWRVTVSGGFAAWLITFVGFEQLLGVLLFRGWLWEWLR